MKFLFFLLLPLYSLSQTFEKSNNLFLKENYIRFYDRNAGVLIQKISRTDTTNTYYEIGLSLFTRGRNSDDFMKKGAVIVFDDNTFLLFLEPIYVNYFQEGKHQYSIKHILSTDELHILQTQKIDYFSLIDKRNDLDKWQKQDILKAFVEIEKQ